MKLIVFLKNKKEIVIKNGKSFLAQRYKGKGNIIVSKKHRLSVRRELIKDFIQARYYTIFKKAYMPQKRAY